jgi:hypothetical protein
MVNLDLRYLALIGVVATSFSTGIGVRTASAADLGGDCCADLEERVAELEATTVRKGNKKVSVTLTGWVAEQVVYWDDGVEQNTYITGLGTAFASNFHITGEAQISPGWKSGYTIWVEADGSDVYTTNQFNDNGVMAISGIRGIQVLKSFWFLESERLGKVSLGLNHPADDSAVVALDESGTLVAAYWVAYDVFSFFVRGNFPGTDRGLPNGTSPSISMVWGNSVSCRGYGGGPGDCNGVPINVVRYDTPVWHGFQGVFSWGEDDNVAYALYYKGVWNSIKFSAVATYSETTDFGQGAPPDGSLEYIQAATYIQHLPSGLFFMGAWGNLDQNGTLFSNGDRIDRLRATFPNVRFGNNPLKNPETDAYYAKVGIRLNPFAALGHTVPYGEYLRGEDGALVRFDDGVDVTTRVVKGSEATFWGFGVVQEIDAAALSMWLRYRQHEVDLPGTGIRTDDIKTVVFGSFMAF